MTSQTSNVESLLHASIKFFGYV